MSAEKEEIPVSQHDEGLFESGSSSSSLGKKKSDVGDIESTIGAQVKDKGSKSNVLSEYSEEQVKNMGRSYALKYGLDPELFERAALLARDPDDFNSMPFLTEEEKAGLNKEATKKWHVPGKLWHVIALGSMAAAVQGMDESVINGADLFYPKLLHVDRESDPELIEGLINGAPYLCASVIACWLSDSCNRAMGRKWTIFLTCFISAITCIWQGFVNNWWHLFIARFFLGFGIGIKSATVPAYAAECTPKQIRGALVMLWQFFTAVGIMFGYVMSLAFYYVPDHAIHKGLNWRLMLGSASLPAIIVLFQIPYVPESPRWLMGKDRHVEAFDALCQLRHERIAAARDHFYQYVLLSEERAYSGVPTWKRMIEMFTIRRNRNGALGAWIVMFMQQFCGINVIAYYSSSIFMQANLSAVKAMTASWGFGMINFLFAIPAFYTIDSFGRRNLLLVTFPLMAAFLMWTAGGFWAENTTTRLGIVSSGIYLFACVYSSGEGPVPFTYSAEAFPLYIRDIGMGFATATCWCFNFILAFTWPKLVKAFKPQGAFGFYAAWNLVGFCMVLVALPETKGLTLEELDEVFSVRLRDHASYQLRLMLWKIRVYILRQNLEPMPPLYKHQRIAVTSEQWNEKNEVSHIE